MLIKSKIPTPEQMVQTNREAESKRDEIGKNKATIEHNIGVSSSSVSLYNIYSDNEDTAWPSSQTPSLIRKITPPPNHGEEMDSSQATINIPPEKHCSNNSMAPEQEGPSSYNIQEVFDSFTFDLHQR